MTADVGNTTADKARGKRETRIGKVVSDKRQKTIGVIYEYSVKHAKYGKYFRRSTMLQAHDENGEAAAGDVVEVTACRPLSKTKNWRLTKVIRKAVQ
jgi:small subunit ribosomal protein S17